MTERIARHGLVWPDTYAKDCQQIPADKRRILNGYVVAFAHDAAVVEYKNLGSVSFALVLRVPLSAVLRNLQVLRFFEVQTGEERSFCVSVDVHNLHLLYTSRLDPS
jgi:hypothetical protein